MACYFLGNTGWSLVAVTGLIRSNEIIVLSFNFEFGHVHCLASSYLERKAVFDDHVLLA